MKIVNTDLNYLILLMLLSIFCMNTLKNERVILIGGNSQKLLTTLCNLKKSFFSKVDFLTITTTREIQVSIKDVESGMGVKNISGLVFKNIYGICETKNPTKKLVNEYKMTKKRNL